jgi:hypothetical protein
MAISPKVITPKAMSVFRYSDEEMKIFPYLKIYSDALANDPPRSDDEDAAERYMLAGLFLTFRACNHASVIMSTEAIPAGLPERHRRRLSKYKELTDNPIVDQRRYLQRLQYNRLLYATIGPGRMLYRYVRFGRHWWQRMLPHVSRGKHRCPDWLVRPQ